MNRIPTYLRVVVTRLCNHSCTYCHAEGDPPMGKETGALSRSQLGAAIRVLGNLGIRKIKFLGGEPLLRLDLADIVRDTRQVLPHADISVITTGAVPKPGHRIDELFAAGLNRVNVSYHGFTREAFAVRQGRPASQLFEQRRAFIEELRQHDRPIKFNYVYQGPEDRTDLAALLHWGSTHGAFINVLDDLRKNIHPTEIESQIVDIIGSPSAIYQTHDSDSLPTRHLCYPSGLRVEVKHLRLGELAAFRTCTSCPKSAMCKEGILALRLDHAGELRPCMDRPDLAFALADKIRGVGEDAARQEAEAWLQALVSPVPLPLPARKSYRSVMHSRSLQWTSY